MLLAAASALFAVFAALALRGPQTERAQVFALLVAVVITSTIVADRGRSRRLRAAATAAFAIAVACSVAALLTTTGAQFSRLTPAAAVGHAAALADAHPDARVLADDFASGPLLWRSPGLSGRIGFDPRFEIYRPVGLRRYVAFIAGTRSWSRVIAGYDVVVVSRFQNPGLAARMRRLVGRRITYSDRTGAVFVRSS